MFIRTLLSEIRVCRLEEHRSHLELRVGLQMVTKLPSNASGTVTMKTGSCQERSANLEPAVHYLGQQKRG